MYFTNLLKNKNKKHIRGKITFKAITILLNVLCVFFRKVEKLSKKWLRSGQGKILKTTEKGE